jgi:hypothetical protein
MEIKENYWLEELRRSDSRIQKLEDIALSLIKFYFLTLFSLVTVVATLYNYKMLAGNESWFFLIFLIPFLFGVSVYKSLGRITIEHEKLQITKNQIGEWFIYGEIQNKQQPIPILFASFSKLIGWLLVVNLLVVIYVAFPIIRASFFNTFILILVGVALAGIMSSIILVSLSEARKKARDASRKSSIASIIPALILYEEKYGRYPIADNFQEMLDRLKEFYNYPIKDPLSDRGWDFGYQSKNGSTYELSYTLEDGGKKVIGPDSSIV